MSTLAVQKKSLQVTTMVYICPTVQRYEALNRCFEFVPLTAGTCSRKEISTYLGDTFYISYYCNMMQNNHTPSPSERGGKKKEKQPFLDLHNSK